MTISSSAAAYWAERKSVVGAFWDVDFELFDRILAWQSDSGVTGDLLEIGALYGKSAIVLGLHARPTETVTICDIFEDEAAQADNVDENAQSYRGLNRGAFEANYGRWVASPPQIVQELSSTIGEHVADASVRFAHIDGGHLFEVVSDDLRNTRPLMAEEGVVVLDDFRALHTPGVAAAAWAAVANDGFVPVCLSEQKLYGAWSTSTARALLDVARAWARERRDEVNSGIQVVAGHEVLVVGNVEQTGIVAEAKRLTRPLRELRRGRPKAYLGLPV